MKLIQQAMEDHYDGLTENEGTHDEDEFQRALLNMKHSVLVKDQNST